MQAKTNRERVISRRELLLIVLAVLPIFFVVGGPIWEHPFSIDRAVYWSYAPIPILVLLILARRGVLSAAGFTVSLVLALSVKYMVTTSIAFVLWTTGEPPARIAQSAGDAPALLARHSKPLSMARPIELGVRGFGAEPIVVHKGEPLLFRSRDRSLHTVRATTAEGALAFHHPIVPGREASSLLTARARGKLELSCAVHEDEHHGTLLVLDN